MFTAAEVSSKGKIVGRQTYLRGAYMLSDLATHDETEEGDVNKHKRTSYDEEIGKPVPRWTPNPTHL